MEAEARRGGRETEGRVGCGGEAGTEERGSKEEQTKERRKCWVGGVCVCVFVCVCMFVCAQHDAPPPFDAWVWAHVRGVWDGRRREVGTEERKEREGGREGRSKRGREKGARKRT